MLLASDDKGNDEKEVTMVEEETIGINYENSNLDKPEEDSVRMSECLASTALYFDNTSMKEQEEVHITTANVGSKVYIYTRSKHNFSDLRTDEWGNIIDSEYEADDDEMDYEDEERDI